MNVLFAVRTTPHEFTIVGRHAPGLISKPRSEADPIGAVKRVVIYDPKAETLTVKTADGVGLNEQLGHMLVQEVVSLKAPRKRASVQRREAQK